MSNQMQILRIGSANALLEGHKRRRLAFYTSTTFETEGFLNFGKKTLLARAGVLSPAFKTTSRLATTAGLSPRVP